MQHYLLWFLENSPSANSMVRVRVTAFLHGNLDEVIYMKQPSGFTDHDHPDFVCRLQCSLYGLKQAPRAWFLRLNSFLLRLGFIGSKADSSLFFKRTTDYVIFMLIYADDNIITRSRGAPLASLILRLGRELAMKDLGPLTSSLALRSLAPPTVFFLIRQNM